MCLLWSFNIGCEAQKRVRVFRGAVCFLLLSGLFRPRLCTVSIQPLNRNCYKKVLHVRRNYF
jgi:hypothetical protein